jgi:hypothetical protein
MALPWLSRQVAVPAAGEKFAGNILDRASESLDSLRTK